MTDQMTNRNKHIQPARRPFNLLVRGGRLTRFKGRVASIAPGLLVVVTAAALFAGSPAQAGCTVTDGVATCAADSQPSSFGVDPYALGIVYPQANAVHTLILPDHPEFTVLGQGVQVDYGGDENVLVRMQNGTVTSSSHGLSARSTGAGNVDAQLDGAADGHTATSASDITISNTDTKGLRARIDNFHSEAEATALMTGGKITIAGGDLTAAVSAHTGSGQGSVDIVNGEVEVTSGGDVTAEMRGGFIHSTDQAGAQASFAVEASSHQTGYIGTVKALMSGGEILTENEGGRGVRATSRSTSEHAEAIAHMSGGKITTTGGDNSFAVNATFGGNAGTDAANNLGAHMVAKITGGEIVLNGSSTAVRAENTGVGNATAEIDEDAGKTSRIIVNGNQAHGLRADSVSADSESDGIARALVIAGTIEIHGDNSVGADSQANGGKGESLTQMTGGSITVFGRNSYGLEAEVDNPDSVGVATVRMTGGTIETGAVRDDGTGGGFDAHGIFVHNTGQGDMIVDMSDDTGVGDGTITTNGRASHGIWAQARVQTGEHSIRMGSATQARAIVKLGTFATVTANGLDSDGIRVSGNRVDADDVAGGSLVQLGAQGFDIDVAGTVKGGAGTAAAIRTISSKVGTIDIASTAHVNAGSSGIAIRTETRGAAGDSIAGVDDGAATITSAGNITGDIELDAGDDRLIVTGGSVTGDVYGSEGNNTLRLEGGRFTGDVRLEAGDNILEIAGGTFTGGIYGGEGDDTVTIFAASTYDGSHILDGGIGDNDRLTLHGQNIRNTANNFRNWERVTLNDTNLRLDELARLDIDQLSINTGSEFRAIGQQSDAPTQMIISGDVTNNGSAVFSMQDGIVGDVITIDGNYTGSGTSVFALDTRMDGTDTDRLHFMGDMSGDMEVSIASVGSAGAEGAPLAIDVVSVDGTSDATFTLVGGNYVTSDGEHAVISGAYLYRLAETAGGWALSALSSTGEVNYQPSLPVYDSYGQSLLALNGPTSLRNRGNSEDFRILAWGGGTDDQDSGYPLWLRMGADRITLSEENSTTGAALDSSLWEMEIGTEIVMIEIGSGLLVGGLMGSYATGSTDVSSAFGDGSIDTTGLGLGVAATWYDTRRFYVDGQFTFTSYSSDLSSAEFGTLTEGNGGTGFAVSLEAGQQLDLGSRLTVIPQAQLSVSSVAFNDFAIEARREQVTFENASSQQLRLGLEFGLQEQEARRFYGIMNLFHEFGAGSEVNVTGAALTTESEPWAAGVGLGGTYVWSDRVDFFGETSYTTGLGNVGDTSALSVNAGLKVTF